MMMSMQIIVRDKRSIEDDGHHVEIGQKHRCMMIIIHIFKSLDESTLMVAINKIMEVECRTSAQNMTLFVKILVVQGKGNSKGNSDK